MFAPTTGVCEAGGLGAALLSLCVQRRVTRFLCGRRPGAPSGLFPGARTSASGPRKPEEAWQCLPSLLVGHPPPEDPDDWSVILHLFPKKTVD